VAFEVNSGKIISARKYSAGGYRNYENLRSMTLSSGSSPMGYVLSNYRTGLSFASCTR
jgi:hypothetical protein